MDFGKIEYICQGDNGNAAELTRLRLTFIGQGDDEVLERFGVAALRHRRIVRLTREADEQGCRLSYDDLCNLLFVSVSTVKRDLAFLEARGIRVVLKRRQKGNGCLHEDAPDAGAESRVTARKVE